MSLKSTRQKLTPNQQRSVLLSQFLSYLSCFLSVHGQILFGEAWFSTRQKHRMWHGPGSGQIPQILHRTSMSRNMFEAMSSDTVQYLWQASHTSTWLTISAGYSGNSSGATWMVLWNMKNHRGQVQSQSCAVWKEYISNVMKRWVTWSIKQQTQVSLKLATPVSQLPELYTKNLEKWYKQISCTLLHHTVWRHHIWCNWSCTSTSKLLLCKEWCLISKLSTLPGDQSVAIENHLMWLWQRK